MNYSVSIEDNARNALLDLDKSIRETLLKRIKRMEKEPPGRHLKKGFPFFVVESGGFRIAYKCDELKKEKIIFFIGNHKSYEKWYSGFF